MEKEFSTAYQKLIINDEGIKCENTQGSNLYFPYGSIVSIRIKGMSFLSELEVIGRNRNMHFSGMSKEDRNEIKRLIPFIEEKNKHAEPVNVMENVSASKDPKALMGYTRASAEVTEFLSKHQKAQDIVKDTSVLGFNKIDNYNIKDLFNKYNARFVFTYHNDPSWKRESCVIITPNMVYLRNGADGKETFYIGKSMALFVSRLAAPKIMHRDVTTKKASVVGSAVAGGVIAGGVGAVVGAVAAADKNANGGRTVVGRAYDSGEREIIVNGVCGAVGGVGGKPFPNVYKIYVSSKNKDNCPIIGRYKDSQEYREFEFTISSTTSEGAYSDFHYYLESVLKGFGGNPNK